MGKAKPAKHTTAEINKKIAEATTNKGGGKDGLVVRRRSFPSLRGADGGGPPPPMPLPRPVVLTHAPSRPHRARPPAPGSPPRPWCTPSLLHLDPPPQDRLGGKAGHAKYQCPVCKVQAPDLKSMQMHFENKHPKETFDESACTNLHEVRARPGQGGQGGTALPLAVHVGGLGGRSGGTVAARRGAGGRRGLCATAAVDA